MRLYLSREHRGCGRELELEKKVREVSIITGINPGYVDLKLGRMKDINVKALVGAFNREKVLVGACSVIVKSSRRLVSSSRGAATFLMSPISLNVENIHLSSAAIKAGEGPEQFPNWLQYSIRKLLHNSENGEMFTASSIYTLGKLLVSYYL